MRAIGIILTGGKNSRLGNLTKTRLTSALPFASSYRAIDCNLSNMTNSGINKVAVITQNNSRSLTDHLSSSRWWNFGRKNSGLFILAPNVTGEAYSGYRGTADAIYQNLSFLSRSNEEYVIITQGESIYSIDYEEVMDYHEEKNADITIVIKELHGEDLSDYGVVTTDSDGRVTLLEEKPLEPETNNVSIAIYVIRRTLLIELMEELHEDFRFDFVTDLLGRYRKKLNIYTYKVDNDFYWRSLNNIQNYFKCNMDFLEESVMRKFVGEKPIMTKAKDEPPVKYNFNADVKKSLIGNGSIISAKIRNSVIFRKVNIKDNSFVSNSIIMESCIIEENCILDYVILDKNVTISSGATIIGTPDDPIIVPKDSIIK